MSLRVLIADDEAPARSRLRSLVEGLGHEVCAEAADGFTVERLVQETHPDALLLDIEMPGTSGLALARALGPASSSLPRVFITAHAEYALDAFDADACDYLLKPVRSERLARALERVTERRSVNGGPYVRLTIGRNERLIALGKLDCFAAEDGYTLARSARIEGFVSSSLSELEERLGDRVLRVHRKFLAVKSTISGLKAYGQSGHQLIFHDGLTGVPVSRRQLNALRRLFQQSDGAK